MKDCIIIGWWQRLLESTHLTSVDTFWRVYRVSDHVGHHAWIFEYMDVLLYCCIVVLLYCCIVVLLYCFIVVLLYCCVVVLLYCCIVVLLCCWVSLWRLSALVSLMHIDYKPNVARKRWNIHWRVWLVNWGQLWWELRWRIWKHSCRIRTTRMMVGT